MQSVVCDEQAGTELPWDEVGDDAACETLPMQSGTVHPTCVDIGHLHRRGIEP